jgi:hypothetical protein
MQIFVPTSMKLYIPRFEVFASMIQVEFFSVVTLYSDVVGYQHFGGLYCLHMQCEDAGSKVFRSIGNS